MSHSIKNNGFGYYPVLLSDNTIDNNKTLSIPIKNDKYKPTQSSRSWSGYSEKPMKTRKNFSSSPVNDFSGYRNKYHKPITLPNSPCNLNLEPFDNNELEYKSFNAIENCKSAGIIPYSIHNGVIKFLFQIATDPQRKKDCGLNDFGGKRTNIIESTAETAAREFSEETSCLFYLKEHMNQQNEQQNEMYYDKLRENADLFYDENAINILKKLIPKSQKYYYEKITEFVSPIYLSSKEIYISYFVKVPYIPESDLPRAEDIHIPYDVRYIRNCKWYTLEELLALNEKDFHKRLQITKIQKRISSYCKKGLFV